MDRNAKALRTWMRAIMAARGWSAERLARKADIAPTTITRFLNRDNTSWIPSMRTVASLEAASGIPFIHSAGPVRSVPVISAKDIENEDEVKPGLAQAETFVPGETEGQLAVQINSESMALGGVKKGDIVLVKGKENKGFQKDDQVVVYHRARKEFGIYSFQPPGFLAAHAASSQEILNIADREIRVLGVAEYLTRKLP